MKSLDLAIISACGLLALGIAGDKYYTSHPKPTIQNETNVNTYRPNIIVGKELIKTNRHIYGEWKD